MVPLLFMVIMFWFYQSKLAFLVPPLFCPSVEVCIDEDYQCLECLGNLLQGLARDVHLGTASVQLLKDK